MTPVQDPFPTYTRLERFADACVHAASLAFSVVATAMLLGAAIGTVPPADVAWPDCLLPWPFEHVRRIRRLQSRVAAPARTQGVPPAPGPRRDLRHDRRQLYAVCAHNRRKRRPLDADCGVGDCRCGITVKLCFPRRFEKLSVLLYLAQGWIVLLALGPVASALPSQALWLLIAGGVVYTLGVPFHLMEWMRFHNVIWHAFVLGGAACQFVAIQAAVLQAA